MACHLPSPPMTSTGGGGNGTSAELAWELIDIFESGMFAFPIYDHDSARDIVRYLLDRGILEEEIADAIKDSTVDMNIWLDKGDKYMVGEWVIAWINACREDYVKQKHAHGQPVTVGYGSGRKRPAAGTPLDGSTDSLGHHMDDDDDDDAWGRGLSGRNEEEEEEEGEDEGGRGGAYRSTDICSSVGFGDGGVPSYSSGLSFSQCDSTDETTNVTWSASSPSSPPTPFHRLAPYLRRTDQPGGASAGARRKNIGTVCWRSVTSPSLQHLLQTVVTDSEKSDSGIVSDLFDRISHDYDDDEDDDNEEDEVEVDVEVEMEERDDERPSSSDKCLALQKSSPCNVVEASFGLRCTCKLPHYASHPPSPVASPTESCPSWGKDEVDSDCHAVTASAAARGQGQYYKDFIIRALEYTLETLDRDGPGYLFILTDSEDRPVTWSNEKRFRVASSNRPELCLAAYRSRNIDVDLLWQVKVSHHNKMAVDVQIVLEKHRLHSNWFKCRLSTIMETVYAIMSRYQAMNAASSSYSSFSSSSYKMNES